MTSWGYLHPVTRESIVINKRHTTAKVDQFECGCCVQLADLSVELCTYHQGYDDGAERAEVTIRLPDERVRALDTADDWFAKYEQLATAVRELHRTEEVGIYGAIIYWSDCLHCGSQWPCPTIRLLDEGST